MNMNQESKSQRSRNKWRVILFLSILLSLSFAMVGWNRIQASEAKITVKEINYEKSTITLQVNSGDTEVYFSASSKNDWEEVPGRIDSNGQIVMDISWVSVSKNQVINIKGDKSAQITSIVIPKQTKNFKAAYHKSKSIITFTNAGNRTIEWRKKNSPIWQRVHLSTLETELSYYYTHGASLVFRLASVNGVSETDTGMRPSNEVTVTIPKRTAAPSVKINGSSFSLKVNKGVTYRTVKDDGTFSNWVTNTSSADLNLFELASLAMYGKDGVQEEVKLQFRKNATNSTQISNIATVIIPIQEGPPEEEKNGITLNYTSSTTLSLTVKSASEAMPFEYSIVKDGAELDYRTTAWKTIVDSNSTSITAKSAPKGSRIYLRKKAVEASPDVEFQLASKEVDVTGSNGIQYPEPPRTDSLMTLITTAGICNTGNTAGNLTFTLYSPTETKVAKIELKDTYGLTKGTVDHKSSVSLNGSRTGSTDRYLITTRIISTANVDSYTNETLYAYITMENGDVISSTATTGIHLYLYPKTTAASSDRLDHSMDFRRVYASIEEEDPSTFSFQLNYGTEYVMDAAIVGQCTDDLTTISSIEYSGYTLVQNRDYTVTSRTITGSNGEIKAAAVVTINVSKFEGELKGRKLDQKLPLNITLSSKEKLNDAVYLTLLSTAIVKDIPIAWSISEGSLKATQTKSITDAKGDITTITEDLITYTIELTLFDSAYSVSVSDVTWGDISVMSSATVSAGKATIYLSNAKINQLETDSTDTKNLVITLSNGFVIESGIKLTIINAPKMGE